ncbi:GNAT family N-acetyltransferase [Streptomyces sp. NPDC001941]|uniref:GNAT family N-acetyltransferase n=1 Tax=Streptomyces sp. NPDC001941 TaxID=3154659 RepID=UPI00332EAFF8
MAFMRRPRGLIDCGDLVLRRWRPQQDHPAAHALIEESLEHLRPWEAWVAAHSAEHTRRFLDHAESAWARGSAYNYGIVRGGALVGMCQSYRVERPDTTRIGYWLHPAATGRGIATRAAAAVADEMFALPGMEYVEIAHDLANLASAAVPRRLGFSEVGHERATPPLAPSGTGVEVIWRLPRPAPG